MAAADAGAAAPAQSWHPESYARHARFVADLGEPVVDLLAPRPGEDILDLGCGDGALTARLVAAGARVVAVDSSAEQVAGARARGLDAHVADGQALAFDGAFDAVFSNAALHWMRDPDAVIDGVWRALRPGGRFVAEMGGGANVARPAAALIAALERRGIDGHARSPWYFPSAEEHSTRLDRRGFRVRSIGLIDRPTRLPGDIAGWLETFAESFLAAVPAGERDRVVDEVRIALAPELRGPDGVWTLDYVRLRFAADKPG